MEKKISFKAKFGWITAYELEGKIKQVIFAKEKSIGRSKILFDFKKQVNLFFLKKTKYIESKIHFSGNNLQIKIWKEIKKIPFGKTKSYKQIANTLNTSPRYVGNICGKNMHLLLIPCHRVIRSDGSLAGFSAR